MVFRRTDVPDCDGAFYEKGTSRGAGA